VTVVAAADSLHAESLNSISGTVAENAIAVVVLTNAFDL
jgi:hypothetical protein